MGGLDDEVMGDRDYPWLLTLDEVLTLCVQHLEDARQSQNGLELGVRLKMAALTLKCALDVYGARLKKEKKE